MLKPKVEVSSDLNPQETSEWLEALDQVLDEAGPDRVRFLMDALADRAYLNGVSSPVKLTTPYVNTIPAGEEASYPGNRAIEENIEALIRWNALAMVVRANKYDDGIGGHISTYQSLATLSEVGFEHFFRGSHGDQPGDFIYYQGHASPGCYSRAYLEGRLTEQHLENFRHELRDHPGLSSYPHPWLMPGFWQFPTVSMGLGPINSIYQARFMRYLENRGMIPVTNRKIWTFVGDGETDEPETLGSITLASREKLDNLIWIVNCNLQRLDGPVRGNGSIVRELEGIFRGAGWNVIKVLWGSVWDRLLEADKSSKLLQRMAECVDGEYQNFKAKGGTYVREHFFGKYPELRELVAGMSDDELGRLPRGGHDPLKVFNAYKRATETVGQPTVILAKTVKGYGMGAAGEARNTAHQQKKVGDEDIEKFVRRFKIDVPAETIKKVYFYRPPADSPEMKYLHERRQALGGYLPRRSESPIQFTAPSLDLFSEILGGSQGRPAMTTGGFVQMLRVMLKDPVVGKYIVPIVPDEARTFGMESLFRQCGIYASQGQLYEPVDKDNFLYYREAKDGQVLEEGITEAGSMGSFTAAGTAYSNYGVPMIPFFIYYSMFGFQRVGDLVWAFADSRGKGFMMGGTAGRTTLSGEGLQHQDGHSPIHASTVPTCAVYDPAFAYEIAVIVQDGLRRMYQENEHLFYYITIYNEFYVQPPMPQEGTVREGILKGIYKCKASGLGPATAQLFGSGPMLNEAIRAQEILATRYNIAADVWSVTSYQQLRRDALAAERWNRLHPTEPARHAYIQQVLEGTSGPVVASSDYIKLVPDQLSPWIGSRLVSLGTDGFGRSESRANLRRFYEINAESIVCATLSRLARDGQFDSAAAAQAHSDLGVDPEAPEQVTR
ncbi:MAG: pyruvate dehydrogenase (acetyl-transferring), homodimeric type [Acidobacteria bacterium]|nr:pyruvate dehydrogenase (acetyl-transferring), homodimeric type [Acidobacteriota bacterium]